MAPNICKQNLFVKNKITVERSEMDDFEVNKLL